MAVAAGETNSGSMPHLCLKWNNYQMNLANVFDQLLQSETFVDVTLAAEGQTVKAHKMVLSACSPYFQALFNENPCPHPIIILKDTKWVDLKAVVEYMYKGEISVPQNELSSLLKVADNLKIRGLSEMDTSSSPSPSSPGTKKPESPSSTSPREDRPTPSPRPAKRRRSSGDQPSSTGPGSPAIDLEPSLSSFGAVTVTPVYPQPQQNSGRVEETLKPGIEDMIREEEKAKLLDSPNPQLFNNAASPNPSMLSAMDAYNMQLQAAMWQRAWAMQQTPAATSSAPGTPSMRFRERGPFKTWRPETMAEAILAVLREGLSLSQAARKYDIPYPTFVLYANRVNNMLGPPDAGQAELRPKGRGRPQRILTGQWADDHVQGVIRAVVFRDPSAMKDIKLDCKPENLFPTLVPPGGGDAHFSRSELLSHLTSAEKDQRQRNNEGIHPSKQFEDAVPSPMRNAERQFLEAVSNASQDGLLDHNMLTMAAQLVQKNMGSLGGQQMNGMDSIAGPSTSASDPNERQACMYQSREDEARMATLAAMTQRLLTNHGNGPTDMSTGIVTNDPVEELESTFDPSYLVGVRVKQEQHLFDI